MMVERDEADVAGREMMVMSGQDRAPQMRRARADGWSAARAKVFFEHLSATCNVKFAADMAGMSHSGAYYRRRTDAVFREAWQDALEAGYARLEAMLIARAGGTHDTAALLAAARANGAGGDGAGGEGAGGEGAVKPTPIAFDPGARPDVSEALDSGLALALMASHRKVLHGQGSRSGGVPAGKADPDELCDAILKQLSALSKRRGKG